MNEPRAQQNHNHKPPPLPEPEKFENSDPGRPWPDKKGMHDPGALAKPLAQDRCRLLEHVDPGHWVCLEQGTPYEKVFDPSFWANVVKPQQFKVGQTIHVRNDEMTIFAVLIILDVGENSNWAVVGEYSRKSIEDLTKSRPPAKEREQYDIRHAGPVEKWRVVRKKDGQVIRARFESEAQAQAFLRDYERRLGQ